MKNLLFLILTITFLSCENNTQLSKSKNDSEINGSEVPQIYIKHENIKRLKGFKKIFLNPRESKNVKIEIPIENLQLWNVDLSRYETQKGKYHIYLGTSSENLIWSNPFIIE